MDELAGRGEGGEEFSLPAAFDRMRPARIYGGDGGGCGESLDVWTGGSQIVIKYVNMDLDDHACIAFSISRIIISFMLSLLLYMKKSA